MGGSTYRQERDRVSTHLAVPRVSYQPFALIHRVVCSLGSGQFGSVEQGVWKRQGTRPVDVALKSLTKKSEEDKVKFLQEAAIMAQFRHPNVIMLYGVVTETVPVRPSSVCTRPHSHSQSGDLVCSLTPFCR